MNPIKAIKRWHWRVSLNLVLAEMQDVRREIWECRQEQQYGTVRVLENYVAELRQEVDALYVKLEMPLEAHLCH